MHSCILFPHHFLLICKWSMNVSCDCRRKNIDYCGSKCGILMGKIAFPFTFHLIFYRHNSVSRIVTLYQVQATPLIWENLKTVTHFLSVQMHMYPRLSFIYRWHPKYSRQCHYTSKMSMKVNVWNPTEAAEVLQNRGYWTKAKLTAVGVGIFST